MDEEEGLYLTLLVPSSAVSNVQNCEKEISVVYKLPNLGYVVIAA